jgi:hypothetical protein
MPIILALGKLMLEVQEILSQKKKKEKEQVWFLPSWSSSEKMKSEQAQA